MFNPKNRAVKMASVQERMRAVKDKVVTVITNVQFIAATSAVAFSAALAVATNYISQQTEIFAGREISCAIDLGQNMFDKNAMSAGKSYEMLQRFADDNGCAVKITAYGRHTNGLDSLLNGVTDILVEIHIDSLCTEKDALGVCCSINYDNVHWAVRSDWKKELKAIDEWLTYFTATEEYETLSTRFAEVRDPRKSRHATNDGQISPYDSVIRQYADSIGWDWRMLAAIVYQESRFAMNTRSHRGAVGLMQIKPSTADSYEVSDLIDPENNISAGTKHLRHLDRLFRHYGLSKEERTKIVLAAYNAGEGRITECLKLAGRLGTDSTTWTGVSALIPHLRDSIEVDDSSLLSHFKGDETIAYVDSVMEIYNSICRLVPAE